MSFMGLRKKLHPKSTHIANFSDVPSNWCFPLNVCIPSRCFASVSEVSSVIAPIGHPLHARSFGEPLFGLRARNRVRITCAIIE